MTTSSDFENQVDASLLQMAEEIFALTLASWRQRLASRRGDGVELSETQFLTLDTLAQRQTLTVGEIQRSIGVLPAQMSRVIRALETSFDKPLIKCELNQHDKRKIDVTLTPAGRRAYDEFRNGRLSTAMAALRDLPEQDRLEFIRICRQMKSLRKKPEADAGEA